MKGRPFHWHLQCSVTKFFTVYFSPIQSVFRVSFSLQLKKWQCTLHCLYSYQHPLISILDLHLMHCLIHLILQLAIRFIFICFSIIYWCCCVYVLLLHLHLFVSCAGMVQIMHLYCKAHWHYISKFRPKLTSITHSKFKITVYRAILVFTSTTVSIFKIKEFRTVLVFLVFSSSYMNSHLSDRLSAWDFQILF